MDNGKQWNIVNSRILHSSGVLQKNYCHDMTEGNQDKLGCYSHTLRKAPVWLIDGRRNRNESQNQGTDTKDNSRGKKVV